MRSLRRAGFVALLSLPLPVSAASTVSLDAIRSHLEFLASDALEGRDTATRGHEIAARYAAAQFRQWGLSPGNGDSYFQPVRLVETKLAGSGMYVIGEADSTALEWKTDYLLWGRAGAPDVFLEAPVVFAGFGIVAENGRDDYADIDVEGKVVLMLSGAPADFPSELRAHYASSRQKRVEAAQRGAAGVLLLRTRDDERRSPWERSALNADRPSMTWRGPDGTPADDAPGLKFSAGLSHEGARKLLVGASLSLDHMLDLGDAGGSGSRELEVRLRVIAHTAVRELESSNVVAVLPGSDPALRGEAIVCTAHLDHVGIGAEVGGDAIYNGYYDNAMGSAIVLEMARVLAASRERPKRTLVFLLVTGEERGLLGSDYFARFPSLAGTEVVADLNVDMPLFVHPVADLVAFGGEHSTLGALAQAAAKANGFRLSPDPEPEESIFVRSDQYSFVRQGIPSLYLDTGQGSRDRSVDGRAAVAGFRRDHYHRPSDDAGLPTDWDGVTRFAAANVDLARAAADAAERPRWLPGSFFGELFGAR